MKEKLCRLNAEYDGHPTTSVTVEMPTELFERVKETAALEGGDYQAIINCYVQQGQMNSRAEVKRLQFAEHLKGVLEKHGVQSDTVDDIFHKLLSWY